MRGSNTLYSKIFEPVKKKHQSQKGRNQKLHSRRNECLVDRYFYYGQKRLGYNLILEKLGDEFFISIYTVPGVIAGHAVQLRELKDLQPKASYFKKKWPQLSW